MAINGDPTRSHILDLEAHDIAASKFAADGKVEHGKVAYSALELQLGPDRPDMLRATLACAEQFALVPGRAAYMLRSHFGGDVAS